MIKLAPLVEAPKKEETITLYYKEGGSDKVYTAILKPEGSGWVVNAQWGRRGSTMQTGTKTNSPVSFDEAKKIYDKLVQSKMAKGYAPGKTDKVYTSDVDKKKRETGTLPQLLNPIGDEELQKYMTSDTYGAQEKYDGKRIIIDISGGNVMGINRKGLAVELPEEVKSAVADLQGETLDGELVGNEYFTFDLLKHEGKGIYTWPYKKRYEELSKLTFGNNVILAPLAIGTASKGRLFNTLKTHKKEGIVFKNLTAPYKAGRPPKGGTQLKHKFWESATCEVSRINAKRSIGIKVLNDSGTGYVDVGNCTVPPNYDLPKVGDMVEIKYLYVLQKGGSLYQPQYLGVRDDKDAPDKESQLKFKK